MNKNKSVKGIYRNGIVELLEEVSAEDETEVIVIFEERMKEKDFIKSLKSKGLVSHIPPASEIADVEPVKVEGKPISEMIIEDRGPR
jgi:hypothetical protein